MGWGNCFCVICVQDRANEICCWRAILWAHIYANGPQSGCWCHDGCHWQQQAVNPVSLWSGIFFDMEKSWLNGFKGSNYDNLPSFSFMERIYAKKKSFFFLCVCVVWACASNMGVKCSVTVGLGRSYIQRALNKVHTHIIARIFFIFLWVSTLSSI